MLTLDRVIDETTSTNKQGIWSLTATEIYFKAVYHYPHNLNWTKISVLSSPCLMRRRLAAAVSSELNLALAHIAD